MRCVIERVMLIAVSTPSTTATAATSVIHSLERRASSLALTTSSAMALVW